MKDTKDYRRFYENLSKARQIFQQKRKREIDENLIKPPYSIIYKKQFKMIVYKSVIEKIKGRSGISVLDLGCGYGEDLLYISQRVKIKGYAADISFNQLNLARTSTSACEKFRFIQSDVQVLPFKEGIFDIVIFSEVIEHLPDPDSAIREILRVMKPGAYLFITTPNKFSYFHFIGEFFPRRLRYWLGNKLRHILWDVDLVDTNLTGGMIEHINLFSFSRLEHLLKQEGFIIERTMGVILEVPSFYLFDSYPFLLKIWSLFDRILNLFSLSQYFKSIIITIAKKDLG